MRLACHEEATIADAAASGAGDAPPASPSPGAPRPSASPPAHASRSAARGRSGAILGSYLDADGRPREIVVVKASAGSRLVVDRDAMSGGDRRLIAHLAADEPAGNAQLVCCLYLAGAPAGRAPCRRVRAEDARRRPFTEEHRGDRSEGRGSAIVDGCGLRYALAPLRGAMRIPELRWWRSATGPARPAGGVTAGGEVVSLREVVAACESYEPACSITRAALRQHAGRAVSSTVLRLELARVLESPIVLNRRLREVVLAAVEREELSMSEIAMRCGRVKRDRNGNESGETSWLGRRLGLLAEGGQRRPTPWIHSDVLALIARRGLGIAPREVEL